jgi:pilus assembly protein CpaB
VSRSVIFFVFTGGLALFAAILVHKALTSKEAKIEALRLSTTRIVVATRGFGPGDTIEVAGLRLTSWPRDDVPTGAFTDLQSVTGRIVKQPIITNQPIVATALLEAEKTGGVLPLLIPPGMRAMSIAVDDVSDISGFVLPYSRVDVLVSVPVTGGATAGAVPIGQITKMVLQNIRVLAVGPNLDGGPDQPRESKVVTLLVGPGDAERLAAASRLGTLTLAMRNFGDQQQLPTAGVTIPALLGAAMPEEAPPPMAPQTTAARARLPRARRAQRVEVIRNGTDHQTVSFVADGRASSASAAGQVEGSAPTDGAAPLP